MKMRAFLLFSSLLPALSAAAQSPAAELSRPESTIKPLHIAVVDIDATGVSDELAIATQQALAGELRKLQGVSVVSFDEIRTMIDLEATRQSLGCDDENACLSELAEALGADVIVKTTLAVVGEEYVFALQRIDQSQAKVQGSVERRLEHDDGEIVLRSVGPAVEELFADRDLLPGATRGVSVDTLARLNPPPLDVTWILAAGLGTAVVAAAAALTVTAHVASRLYYGAYLEAGQGAAPGQLDHGVLRDRALLVNISAVSAWGMAALVVAGAVGTASLIPFTDFLGYGDE